MTFGRYGQHRDHRSEGQVSRSNGEIFIDVLQGKLSEYAFYNFFRVSDVDIPSPDIRAIDLEEWDSSDFTVNGFNVAVKFTKSFGNLLLLGVQDWDSCGRYIPNRDGGISEFDFFVLIRIKSDVSYFLRGSRMLYVDDVDYDALRFVVIPAQWDTNLADFITRTELVEDVIGAGLMIHQNSLLNGKTRMDADNYYVQAGDLHSFSELIVMLRDRQCDSG